MVSINWTPGMTLDEVEKACILQAYRWYRGNKTQTAIALGISVKTIDNKLEKYEADGIAAKEQDDRDEIERRKVLNRMRGLPEDTPHGEEKRQESIFATDSGVRVQPAVEAGPESPVSVPQRKEVQKVLPGQASAGGQRGRR